METTLVVPDEIFREAKSRATLKGQTLGKFLEQGLRRILQETERSSSQASRWVRGLPRVSPAAAAELQKTVNAPDFRQIDEAMW